MNWIIIGSDNGVSPFRHLTSVKFWYKFNNFYSRKCIWKCRLHNYGHFIHKVISLFLTLWYKIWLNFPYIHTFFSVLVTQIVALSYFLGGVLPLTKLHIKAMRNLKPDGRYACFEEYVFVLMDIMGKIRILSPIYPYVNIPILCKGELI